MKNNHRLVSEALYFESYDYFGYKVVHHHSHDGTLSLLGAAAGLLCWLAVVVSCSIKSRDGGFFWGVSEDTLNKEGLEKFKAIIRTLIFILPRDPQRCLAPQR